MINVPSSFSVTICVERADQRIKTYVVPLGWIDLDGRVTYVSNFYGLRVTIEPFIVESVDTSRPLLDLDLSILQTTYKLGSLWIEGEVFTS